ncbi:MAG: SDR family NAD(P)-dependent oxidoreductase [Solirubrobacterales bacterium]|nr:SDR family NAD(P)-dependent oxidoreductase [Solirubrobacterales bacterium]
MGPPDGSGAVRTALITGAASGIGAGVARRLSRLGYRLALLDIHGEGVSRIAAGLDGTDSPAVGVGADVSDESAVRTRSMRCAISSARWGSSSITPGLPETVTWSRCPATTGTRCSPPISGARF